MSDKTDINILTTTALTYAKATKPETKRAIAVFAALEAIKSDLISEADSHPNKLDAHMGSLSRFADQIQEALEV